MGYKCSNCNVDFPHKRAVVAHMIDVHESAYLEGDEVLIKMSKEHIAKMADKDKAARLTRAYEGVE